MTQYANSETLVDKASVVDNLNNPSVRTVKVDADTSTYHEGHTPGARNIPWSQACDFGAFKSFDELRALYSVRGTGGSRPVITYCRIGERSSHTWFVLNYLLGDSRGAELQRFLDRVGEPCGRAVARTVELFPVSGCKEEK